MPIAHGGAECDTISIPPRSAKGAGLPELTPFPTFAPTVSNGSVGWKVVIPDLPAL